MNKQRKQQAWAETTATKLVAIPSDSRIPTWFSTAFLEGGTVYLPAIIAGIESVVSFMACDDGASVISDEGHAYVPAEWMASEFPEIADDVRATAARVRYYAELSENGSEEGGKA